MLKPIGMKRATNQHRIDIRRVPCMFFIFRADSRLAPLYISEDCKLVTGFRKEKFFSKNDFWKNRIHPGDLSRVLSRIKRMGLGKDLKVAFRWKWASGRYADYFAIMNKAVLGNAKPPILAGVMFKMSGVMAGTEDDRRGHPKLTRRHVDVLKGVVAGLSNNEIAKKLSLSRRTIESHRDELRARLGLRSTAQMTIYAIASGLISYDEAMGLIGIDAEKLNAN